MRDSFLGLWKRLEAEGNAQETLDFLNKLYSEPHRFYHNLKHIMRCLDEFSGARHLAENPDMIELAIWFHDAVYDTHSTENEEKSAGMAYDVCIASGLQSAFAHGVHDLVLVTKHTVLPVTMDGKIMADTDLSSFGKPAKEFHEDGESIRREYGWVAEDEYSKHRIAILKAFLDRLSISDRPSIYHTEFFRSKYESQAKANLEASILKLRQ